MEKGEYLELAKQKGWDTKIPQLEDETYDCDVFGGDDVAFYFDFCITGTLYLKENALFEGNVSAHEGIVLGNGAGTYDLSSDSGDVIIGDDADTSEITGKNVICGDNLHSNGADISATDGFVILGKEAHIFSRIDHNFISTVSATEDIICDDEPA